jgi:hypothetical protein
MFSLPTNSLFLRKNYHTVKKYFCVKIKAFESFVNNVLYKFYHLFIKNEFEILILSENFKCGNNCPKVRNGLKIPNDPNSWEKLLFKSGYFLSYPKNLSYLRNFKVLIEFFRPTQRIRITTGKKVTILQKVKSYLLLNVLFCQLVYAGPILLASSVPTPASCSKPKILL